MGIFQNMLLKKYSTRAWAYRPNQGWVFDDLTPDELAIFRADRPCIETVRLPIEAASFTSYTSSRKHLFMLCTLKESHPQAFALLRFYLNACTLNPRNHLCKTSLKPDVRPQEAEAHSAISRWKHIVGKDRIEDGHFVRYPVYDVNDPLEVYDWMRVAPTSSLYPGLYMSWLWTDQIEVCRALGCDITVHHGFGWRKMTPPTKMPPRPRYSEERTFIYALIDPLTYEVFYIGKSDHPEHRFDEHLRDKSDSPKVWRINQICSQGHLPTLTILEEVDGVVALEREDWWTRYYENAGHHLTNYVSQWRPSKERKERRRRAMVKIDYRKEYQRVACCLKQAHVHEQAATLTLEDWADTLAYFEWKCAYCKNSPFEWLDYLIPLQQGGGVKADNCIPVCRACKSAKRTLSAADVQAFHAYIEYGATVEIGPVP